MNNFRLSILLVFLTSLTGNAQETLFNHFYSMQDKTPVIKIETDIKSLIKNKYKEEYQPSNITFELANGEQMICESKLRARGNVRKKVCYNPPLKINLKEKDLIKNGFDSLDILKLVLQCRNTDTTDKYLFKERLAYDLYSLIDTLHMRTKCVIIELYEDGELKETLDAFLVETEDHYAQRTNMVVVEKGVLRSGILSRGHFLKMSFFQYMIGNPDYAIPNKHNVEILQTPDKRYLAVPYDFDYSGLVDTDYAIPHESIPIKKVTERIFMAKNVSLEEANATADFFREKKDQIYATIESAAYLGEKDKKYATKYINGFFKVLDSERQMEREFTKR